LALRPSRSAYCCAVSPLNCQPVTRCAHVSRSARCIANQIQLPHRSRHDAIHRTHSNDAAPAKRKRQSVRKAGERDPRLPLAGAWIEREYQGKKVRVMVLHHGFLCNGKQYRSLSGLARELTGTNHNGLIFFGLIA
jgi:hypothetical protein